jgi:hypothetical protein
MRVHYASSVAARHRDANGFAVLAVERCFAVLAVER